MRSSTATPSGNPSRRSTRSNVVVVSASWYGCMDARSATLPFSMVGPGGTVDVLLDASPSGEVSGGGSSSRGCVSGSVRKGYDASPQGNGSSVSLATVPYSVWIEAMPCL